MDRAGLGLGALLGPLTLVQQHKGLVIATFGRVGACQRK
jgi:hypothetical protein